MANGDGDHCPVAVQLCWKNWSALPSFGSKPCPIDRAAITSAALADALRTFPVLTWDDDIEQHVEAQNDFYIKCLEQHCPKPRCGPKKKFLSDSIWQLRNAKVLEKKRLKNIGQRQGQENLRVLFDLWKKGSDDSQIARFWNYGTSLRIWRLVCGARLSSTARLLKRSLQKARTKALAADLTNLPADASANDVLRIVKTHVGSTNAKHCKRRALPLLHDTDGSPCALPAQLLNRWITFFGDMEGARRLSDADQRSLWIQGLQRFRHDHLQLSLDDLPSLTDLEIALRRVRKNKAIGLDMIPPELCHACPTILARQLYGALLKLVCHGQEALPHKGGLLTPAFKGKGIRIKLKFIDNGFIQGHTATRLQ